MATEALQNRELSTKISSYYDQNTPRFLRWGGSADLAAIHRAIWAPGVTNRHQAFLYLNQAVYQHLLPFDRTQSFPPNLGTGVRLLDLGCGVAGTATWLAHQSNLEVIGITNSSRQVETARQRIHQMGIEERCQVFLADFHQLPALGKFDGAYAIESFAHSHQAHIFSQQVAQSLKSGSRLVICDDFRSEHASENKQAQRWLTRFQHGWQIPNLLSVGQTISYASAAGLKLVEDHDLTPYLAVKMPLFTRCITYLTQIPIHAAYWQNLSGGSALKICYLNRWTEYHVLIWKNS